MALPEATLTIRDPGLGIVPANAGRVQVKAGACSKATPNVLQSLGSVAAAKSALGSGPLLDAVVQVLDVAGGPVIALPILPSSQGTLTGAFALTGSGAGTITGSKGPETAMTVKIILGGALGTMTFQVKIGSGGYGATITSVASGPWSYQVPGAYFDTLVFAAGTYVAADTYVVNLDGTVTRTGTGTATLLDGSTHSPVDALEVWVKIVTAGALGTAAFQYSLDGGKTYSAVIATPAAGKYVIAGTGIVLTLVGPFVVGDLYKGSATAPGYGTGDLNTAMTALLLDPTQWGWVHVVGQASTAAGAASVAVALDAHMTAAESAFRYVFGIVECPQAEGDAAIKSAFLAFASSRIGIAVGDTDLFSRLTGRSDRRNVAWSFTARLGKIKLSKDPGEVKQGAIKNVSGLYRDEWATQGLDEARFITARSHIGLPSYYFTNFRMMATPGSDFTYGMNRRVMDRACVITRQAYLYYLNSDVRIDKTTGYIDERDAQAIDAVVTAKLDAALIDEQEASAVTSALSRTDNLLSTSTANAEVNVIPKGYLKTIAVTIGFQNPVLQAAA